MWRTGLRVLKQIGWLGLLGLGSATVLGIVFIWLTEEVFENEFSQLDNGLALWLHGLASPALTVFLTAMTTVGGVAGITTLTVVTFGLLWRFGQLRSAWLVAIAVGGGILINQLLKFWFQRPRPELWPITGARLTTFSFPSGHSTASLCYFGILAWLAWQYFKKPLVRWSCVVLAALIILLVGISRVYLGAHYPTDVLAGYLSGGVWLIAVLNSRYIWRQFHPILINNGGVPG